MQNPQTFCRALAIVGIVSVGVVNALRAQAPAADTRSPAFEIASVKPNQPGNPSPRGTSFLQGGRFYATSYSLRALIRLAYQIQDFQLDGLPSWAGTRLFDINARARDDQLDKNGRVPFETGRLMVRRLLADRFQLLGHYESRELPIYELILARHDGKLGPQLRQSTVDCDVLSHSGTVMPRPAPRQAPICGADLSAEHMIFNALPMSRLALSLSTWVDRMVTDRTGLIGPFDLDLQWSLTQVPQFDPSGNPIAGTASRAPSDSSGLSIFTALQEQLGLKLESTKGPVDVLVIDHVEQPTPD
jgi:uncharacterized protein (TIGR03435 family)